MRSRYISYDESVSLMGEVDLFDKKSLNGGWLWHGEHPVYGEVLVYYHLDGGVWSLATELGS